MALDYLTNQITDYRKQAAQIQDQATRFARDVQSDPNLSEKGKQEQIAADTTTFKARIAEVRAKELAAVRTKKDSLTRTLFGSTTSNPSDVIAYRDAQDRAERLTDPQDAVNLLNRATVSGDKSLASAVLLRAVDSNWRSVITAYSNDNPGSAQDLEDLREISRFEQGGFDRTLAYAII